MIEENLREAECKEPETTVPLRAYRAGSDKRPRIRFYLPKHYLEKQTQTKLEWGKMYQIKGRVEGIFKFRIDCIEPKTRGFDIYVPKRNEEKVKLAEEYNIIISSVEARELTEASRQLLGSLKRGRNWIRTFNWIFRQGNEHLQTGHELEDPKQEPQAPMMVRSNANKFIVLKAHSSPQRSNPHFVLSKRMLEDIWGISFEEGMKYEIKWRVGESEEFTRNYIGGKSRHFILGVPKEYPSTIHAGEEYKICIFSVNEKPRFRVAQSRSQLLVRITKTALELTGFNQGDEQKNNRFVVEIKVQNLSVSERPIRRCFSIYERSGKRVVLPLGSWEARPGDILQPLSSKRYTVDDFVRDFNFSKSKEFGNIRLNPDVNQITMEVDGKKIILDQLHLDARGLRAGAYGKS